MDALFFTIILLAFYSQRLTHAEWIIRSENRMPGDDTTMAIGTYNGNIYLLGGINRNRQQTIFNIERDTFTFYQSAFVPNDTKVSGQAQYWTQLGFNLYILNDFDPQNNKISVYNMNDNSFNSEFDTVPKAISDGMGSACVASSVFHNSIFVNGGITATGKTSTETIVLNLETMRWEIGSQMQTARRSHSCIVHSNGPALYSIGGSNNFALTETIEKIYIGNIHDNEWISLNGSLSYAAQGLRSFIYGNNIIIIGGISGRRIYDTIHILDTTTDLVTLSETTLAFGAVYSAAIMVNDIMYSFGGKLGTDMDLWQSQWMETTSTPTYTSSITTTPQSEDSNEFIPTVKKKDESVLSTANKVGIGLAVAFAVCFIIVVIRFNVGKNEMDDHDSLKVNRSSSLNGDTRPNTTDDTIEFMDDDELNDILNDDSNASDHL